MSDASFRHKLLLLALLAAVAVVGRSTAAPDSGMPAPGQALQAHARGVFFDWRPVQAEALRMARASQPTAAQLQNFKVIDRNGFAQPVPALDIDLPRDWQRQGRVDWDKSSLCTWNGPRMNLSAASPDGLHGITVLPTMGWQVSSLPIDRFDPCPAAPMRSVRDYLQYIAGNLRPGARVIAFRERPELSKPHTNFPVFAGELLIGYTLQGHEMRESLLSWVSHTRMAPGGILVNAGITLAVRSPDGLLDFGFVERVRGSLRINDDWYRRYRAWGDGRRQEAQRLANTALQNWHNQRMREINLAGMTAIHRINMDAIAEIGRINTRIFNDRVASSDRLHALTIDSIREVQPWRDPESGKQVQLSMHYRHAWQLADGRQFLTNDPDFQPYRDLGIAGHALQPVR